MSIEESDLAPESVSIVIVNPETEATGVTTAGLVSRPARLWFGLKPIEVGFLATVSAIVLAASYAGWWSIGVEEAWGFVTGGLCVWLVVREHMWNWPIGLANN